jgi:DNA-directed RNA polymerase subunit M/transcription elongation factor TFIIS
VEWYCDGCGEYLNDQPGFNDKGGAWTCTKCGYHNYLDDENIKTYIDENGEEHDNPEYDENFLENAEGLSVEDAALIWRSHGKDEDYMFGYTEEELEDA